MSTKLMVQSTAGDVGLKRQESFLLMKIVTCTNCNSHEVVRCGPTMWSCLNCVRVFDNANAGTK